MKTTLQKAVMSILLAAAIAMTGCDTEEPTKPLPEYPEAKKPEVEKPPVIVPPVIEPPAEEPPVIVPPVENPTTTPEDTTTNAPGHFLVGTKWKLIVIGAKGIVKAPEPDSERRFLINFDTADKLSGRTSTNEMFGNYELSPPSTFKIKRWGGTKMGEISDDGDLFYDSIPSVRSYEATDSTLKLIYNEADYFLFKLK